MPHKYMYHCKKCGFNLECISKQEWAAAKRWHKTHGCQLEEAPHKHGTILTRPQLADEASEGRQMLIREMEKQAMQVIQTEEKDARDKETKEGETSIINPPGIWVPGMPIEQE